MRRCLTSECHSKCGWPSLNFKRFQLSPSFLGLRRNLSSQPNSTSVMPPQSSLGSGKIRKCSSSFHQASHPVHRKQYIHCISKVMSLLHSGLCLPPPPPSVSIFEVQLIQMYFSLQDAVLQNAVLTTFISDLDTFLSFR